MRASIARVLLLLAALLALGAGLHAPATVAQAAAASQMRLQAVAPVAAGAETSAQARLDDPFGRPIPDSPIEFYVDSTRKGRVLTDANGIATYVVKGDVPPGIHTLKAVFGGSQDFGASLAAVEFLVLDLGKTNLLTEALRPLNKGEAAMLVARLVDGLGHPIFDQPVDLYLDSARERRIWSDANGDLRFPVSGGLAPGSHEFRLTYSGSAKYEAATAVVTVLVKAPAPSRLRIEALAPVPTGGAPTLSVFLTTAAGEPLADQLLDVYVDGARSRRVWTNPAGNATTRLESDLSPGAHTLRLVFAGTDTLAPASATAELQVLSPVRTVLALQPDGEYTVGDRVSLDVKLTNAAGAPVADQAIDLIVDGRRERRSYTGLDGVASFRIQSELAAGQHELTAVFEGSVGFAAARVTEALAIRPAKIQIRTVPPLAGVRFSLDGRTFTSDQDGIAWLQAEKVGTYRLGVSSWENLGPDVKAEFRRWGDDEFEPVREVRVSAPISYEVGFDISYRVSQTFQDLSGQPVDPKRITSFTLKGSQGTTHVFEDGQSRWLQSGRIVRRQGGLEETRLLYSVVAVMVEGMNVVNQSQQRFLVKPDDQWPIQLLLYSVRISARDALFGFPVGQSVQIDYPSKRSEEEAFDAAGEVEFRNLARGPYRFTVKGAWGIAPTTPVDVSKDQTASLQVITYLDIALVASLLAVAGFGLLFFGRPSLLVVFRPRALARAVAHWEQENRGLERLRAARDRLLTLAGDWLRLAALKLRGLPLRDWLARLRGVRDRLLTLAGGWLRLAVLKLRGLPLRDKMKRLGVAGEWLRGAARIALQAARRSLRRLSQRDWLEQYRRTREAVPAVARAWLQLAAQKLRALSLKSK